MGGVAVGIHVRGGVPVYQDCCRAPVPHLRVGTWEEEEARHQEAKAQSVCRLFEHEWKGKGWSEVDRFRWTL